MKIEVTLAEYQTLGKLVGEWRGDGGGEGWFDPGADDALRAQCVVLTKRGGWAEEKDGRFKITNYGINAFYSAKVITNTRKRRTP